MDRTKEISLANVAAGIRRGEEFTTKELRQVVVLLAHEYIDMAGHSAATGLKGIAVMMQPMVNEHTHPALIVDTFEMKKNWEETEVLAKKMESTIEKANKAKDN